MLSCSWTQGSSLIRILIDSTVSLANVHITAASRRLVAFVGLMQASQAMRPERLLISGSYIDSATGGGLVIDVG
jgi:hypothetical protein